MYLKQNGLSSSVYKNVSLETGLNQLTLGDTVSRHGQLYNGSNAPRGDKTIIYAGSDALEMEVDVSNTGSGTLRESQCCNVAGKSNDTQLTFLPTIKRVCGVL